MKSASSYLSLLLTLIGLTVVILNQKIDTNREVLNLNTLRRKLIPLSPTPSDSIIEEDRRQKRLKKLLRIQSSNSTSTSDNLIVKEYLKVSDPPNPKINEEKHKLENKVIPAGIQPIRKSLVPQQASSLAVSTPAVPENQSVRKIGSVPQQAAPVKTEDNQKGIFSSILSAAVLSKSKSKSSILTKPDIIPGVLRSIPVSNSLSIHPIPQANEEKPLKKTLGSQIEIVLGISDAKKKNDKASLSDKKDNIMSFLQTNEKLPDPTTKPTMPPIPLKHDEFKEYSVQVKDKENDKDISKSKDNEKDLDKQKDNKDKENKNNDNQKENDQGKVKVNDKEQKNEIVNSKPDNTKPEDKTSIIDKSLKDLEVVETAMKLISPEHQHIEQMNKIDYDCNKKKDEEKEKCEELEKEKRHEVEVEEKEKKEETLKLKYEKKDELLGKLAKDMKDEYKIRDFLADRKEEGEESRAETLFVIFMLLLFLLFVLLSLSGFNLCTCIYRQIKCCLRNGRYWFQTSNAQSKNET